MSVREEFDEWAAAGKDRDMERRHWHTARQILARMPIEDYEENRTATAGRRTSTWR